MTRQCLSHKRPRTSYSWGRNSPKSRVSVLGQATWPTGIGQMSTGSLPTVSTLGKQPGENPALRPDLSFLPTPRNAGEVSSLPSCLFLNKSSKVLKLCEMGEGTLRLGWARLEFKSKSTNSVWVKETNQASRPWWTGTTGHQEEGPLPQQCSGLLSVVSWTVHPCLGTKFSGMCPGQTFEDSESGKLVTGPGSSSCHPNFKTVSQTSGF